ncbi:unnamed protein product [Caenorhabditis sp. 36 PRJEB53466]|nr:unnamed protein product [Caenorhabditis sp. 36 PRJEB53466]
MWFSLPCFFVVSSCEVVLLVPELEKESFEVTDDVDGCAEKLNVREGKNETPSCSETDEKVLVVVGDVEDEKDSVGDVDEEALDSVKNVEDESDSVGDVDEEALDSVGDEEDESDSVVDVEDEKDSVVEVE